MGGQQGRKLMLIVHSGFHPTPMSLMVKRANMQYVPGLVTVGQSGTHRILDKVRSVLYLRFKEYTQPTGRR